MSAPKEGIYLDATLDQIGSRLESQIDRMSRRTRRRSITLISALIVATAGFGAVAAAATVPVLWPVETHGTYEFNCVEGDNVGNYPYFGVRFSVVDAPKGYTVDPVRICSYAWKNLDVTPKASVDDRIRAGDDMDRAATGLLEDEARSSGFSALPEFEISQLQWGPVNRGGYNDVVPVMVVCEREVDGALWVLSADPGQTQIDGKRQCAVNHGFALWQEK